MLNKTEKIGEVLGYIPIVSTVSGLYMARYYSSKEKEAGILANDEIRKIELIANRTLDFSPKYESTYKKLRIASYLELIPIVNIIAAIYSSIVLSRLSQRKEVNQAHDSQKKFLFEKYNIPFNANKDLFDVLLKLYNTNPSNKGIIETDLQSIRKAMANNEDLKPFIELLERDIESYVKLKYSPI